MKNVIVGLFVLLTILVSCKQKVKEELNYSDKLLTEAKSKIKLIKLNNGYNFVPDTNITYIDLLILNDSTVEFKDSVYYSIDSTNLIGLYQRHLGDERDVSFGIKRLLPELKKITDSTDKEVQFNFFFDSSATMVSLNRLYEDLSLNFTRDKVKWINMFGRENKHCRVNFIEKRNPTALVCFFRDRNDFKIFFNKQGDMMVESNWEADQDYLKQELINFYVNPKDLEMYPELRQIDEELCFTNLKILRVKLSDYKSSKTEENIKQWEEYLQVAKLVGEFRILPKSAYTHIQIDNKIPVANYYEVIDTVYGVINQLKNTAAQSTFGKTYFELDSIHELKQKEALDIIYQPKINETILYPRPPPPEITGSLD